MPQRITIDIANMVLILINAFSRKIRLYKTYIPRTIMKGKQLNSMKSCRIPFGAYAQVNYDRNITNTMEERRKGTICIRTTGNLQGTYNFLSLRMGRNITCGKFTEISTPGVVFRRVTSMAIAEKQGRRIIFENRNLV